MECMQACGVGPQTIWPVCQLIPLDGPGPHIAPDIVGLTSVPPAGGFPIVLQWPSAAWPPPLRGCGGWSTHPSRGYVSAPSPIPWLSGSMLGPPHQPSRHPSPQHQIKAFSSSLPLSHRSTVAILEPPQMLPAAELSWPQSMDDLLMISVEVFWGGTDVQGYWPEPKRSCWSHTYLPCILNAFQFQML